MFIWSIPNENGYYGNPHSIEVEGDIKLPDELLSDYIEAKGFVILEITNDTVTSVKLNEEAYNAYIASLPEPTEDKQSKIAELKRNLAKTDYIAAKIAEGAATREEYADVIAQRQAWRDAINRLEET